MLWHHDLLSADKFGVKAGLPILKEHFNNFPQVVIEFIEAFRLGMGPGKTRHVTDIEASVGASFYDRSKTSHLLPRRPSSGGAPRGRKRRKRKPQKDKDTKTLRR